MALKVRWSLEAEETFDAIIEYLENTWTEREVRNFVNEALKVIRQIERNPYQFKSAGFSEVRKGFITKHTSLFYSVNEQDEQIELFSFWNNRKDPHKLPI